MKGLMCKFKSVITFITLTIITLISGCDYALQQQLISLKSNYSHQATSITLNKTFNTQNQFTLTSKKVNTNTIVLDRDSYSEYSIVITNLPNKKSVVLFRDNIDSYAYNQVKFNFIPIPNSEMNVNIELPITLLSIDLLDKGNIIKTYTIEDIRNGFI